jgi:hypothetical protein
VKDRSYHAPDVAKIERGKNWGGRRNKLDEISEYPYTGSPGSIWVNPRRIKARVEVSVAIAWVEQWRIIGPSYTATTLFIHPKKTDLIERERKLNLHWP